MAGPAAVALLGFVLEDLDLVAAKVLGNRCLDLDLLEFSRLGDELLAADQHRPQGNLVACLRLEAVDDQHRAFFDPILLATTFNNRVHNRTHKSLSG